MKIRTDFVSNSSSSSFIVIVDDICKSNLALLTIADNVWAAYSHEYDRSNYDEPNKVFTNDLVEKLYNQHITSDKPSIDESTDVLFNIDIKKLLKPENKELLTEFLNQVSYFEIEHGDDCGEEYEFYGYASWLMSKHLTLRDSENSSLALFDYSRYDETYQKILTKI